MFRLATCMDLIELKCRYPEAWVEPFDMFLNSMTHGKDYRFSESFRWGLKQMGQLFCVDRIEKRKKAERILEVGAGFNLFFERFYGEKLEYWIVDQPGHYTKSAFEAARGLRKRARQVEGLLGENLTELPDCYFDAVFSISVIEHVPAEKIPAVCREMARVLKPGGSCLHSLDVHAAEVEQIADQWQRALAEAELEPEQQDHVKVGWSVGPDMANTTLQETLHAAYGGWQSKNWQEPRNLEYPIGTILVAYQKPRKAFWQT